MVLVMVCVCVCGLYMFPDMCSVSAYRPSTSPPCLNPAPVQTCLPPACRWRVRCPASKPSVSRRKPLFQQSSRQGESDSTGARRNVCLDIREPFKEKNVKKYNLTHACSCRRTDTDSDIHTKLTHVEFKKKSTFWLKVKPVQRKELHSYI